MEGKTLFEKVWDAHVVYEEEGKPSLIYVDLHLVHEVTSPQAFEGIKLGGRTVRRPDLTFATKDHNVPTTDRSLPVEDEISAKQMETLRKNCEEYGIELYGITVNSHSQGIVHVIGPELGLTKPGMTIVCGDSHTSTHGAFGALAFGIGTSEVEHVLATQCLWQNKPKVFEIKVEGERKYGVTAKDIILSIIGHIGTAGATHHVVEYRGSAIEALSMEERMTICNMSIEGGARAGMIAPDQKTYDFVHERKYAPAGKDFDEAVSHWKKLSTDENAVFDKSITLHAEEMAPQVSWGTNPGMVTDITSKVPDPDEIHDEDQKKSTIHALEYMDLKPNTPIEDIRIDRVFIGSCTNARLEDLTAAAKVVKGKQIADSVHAMVVPGSQLVKMQAEKIGLDKIFKDAGFEWREAGCSMCLGMNADILLPGERCASTSNRNFEGRQGKGGRTHLVSPIMAAAAAIEGHFVDVRSLELNTDL